MENTTEMDLLAANAAPTEPTVRQPYERPSVQTTQGALTALLGSAAECQDPGGDPPDLA